MSAQSAPLDWNGQVYLKDRELVSLRKQYSQLNKRVHLVQAEAPGEPLPLEIYDSAFSLLQSFNVWQAETDVLIKRPFAGPDNAGNDDGKGGSEIRRELLSFEYSDAVLIAFDLERDILRRNGPPVFGTTNYEMGLLDRVTYDSNGDTQVAVDCSICISGFKDGDILCSLPCAHKFHEQCVLEWLKSNRTCPLCRANVSKYWWYNNNVIGSSQAYNDIFDFL